MTIPLTKPQQVYLRSLAEFPAEEWLSGGTPKQDKLVDQLVQLGLVEFNAAEISSTYRDHACHACCRSTADYRLTTSGRTIAKELAIQWNDELLQFRVTNNVKLAQVRCSELAKIEIIRPRPAGRPVVERISEHTLTYDPAFIEMMDGRQLQEAIVKAVNDWALMPEAPESDTGTAQPDTTRKHLPEMHPSDVELLKRIEPVLAALLSDGMDRHGRRSLAKLLWDVRWRLKHASGVETIAKPK